VGCMLGLGEVVCRLACTMECWYDIAVCEALHPTRVEATLPTRNRHSKSILREMR